MMMEEGVKAWDRERGKERQYLKLSEPASPPPTLEGEKIYP